IETLEDLKEQLHFVITTVTLEILQRAQEDFIHRVNM
ncbi:hypothetical protein EAG_06543, partial [Camponotus floridanus]